MSKAKISHQLNGNGIFVVKFTGDIPFDLIIEYLDDFEKIKGLPKKLFMLYDFTNAAFDLDQAKIKAISDKAGDVTIDYEFVYTAFVVAEPKVTAYTMLFSLMLPNERSKRELFSTVSGAQNWLNSFA